MKNKVNIIYLLKSILLSFTITIVLMLVTSLILRFTSLHESKLSIINNVIMVVSISSASIYLAMKIRENGWLYGSFLGLSYYLIILFLNAVFMKENILNPIYIIRLVVALLIGAIGGIIGINLI